MNDEYSIELADESIDSFIHELIVKHNLDTVPLSQKELLYPLRFVIKNNKGEWVAGITGCVYLWNILSVDYLAVKEDYRNQGLGKALLAKIETEAKQLGATDAHLDTFDFQAKDFCLKFGFQIFGELKDCPKGHSRFYMHKKL